MGTPNCLKIVAELKYFGMTVTEFMKKSKAG
jgi:hypothetical protein